jgi:hypothetical protein
MIIKIYTLYLKNIKLLKLILKKDYKNCLIYIKTL